MTEITIKPFSAQLTRDVDTFSTMDPYCKVMVGSNFQRTPTHKNGGKSPSWQCTLTFNRTIETAIKFEVWDSNTGKDQLIGEGTLDWNYAFANG
jgi:Ca2+-dependent lipid-binding protein